MNFLILFLISVYQKWIAPILGNHCRFHPTCSQYAKECFSKFSFSKAFFKSIFRILKCNPWHSGGVDFP